MSKTGIKMPGILKGLMKMAMGKFRRVAKKSGVELIGQVTGANGKLLQEASDLVGGEGLQKRPARTVSLGEIEQRGLGKGDVGKMIVFA